VANDACDGGRVSVNGKQVKPSYTVKVGDIIEIAFGERKIKARITQINEVVRKENASDMYEIIGEE